MSKASNLKDVSGGAGSTVGVGIERDDILTREIGRWIAMRQLFRAFESLVDIWEASPSGGCSED